jgi:hypothetical protein
VIISSLPLTATIPNAEFVPIEWTDHLGVDTAQIDPVLPAVLRTLRPSP